MITGNKPVSMIEATDYLKGSKDEGKEIKNEIELLSQDIKDKINKIMEATK